MVTSNTVQFWRRGKIEQVHVPDPNTTLLELLRNPASPAGAQCKGTKEGCGEGDCGACTVALGELQTDGQLHWRAVNSCIRLAQSINGQALITVQDLAASPGVGHPVQQAMQACFATQCGFCTPGFVMSLFVLHETQGQQGTFSRDQVQQAVSGNLCRCTGYRSIIEAGQTMAHYGGPGLDGPAIAQALRVMSQPAQSTANPDDKPTNTGYCRPATLAQALAIRKAQPNALVAAGTTDVGLWITKQHQRFDLILDISALAELKAIGQHQQSLRIGAGAKLTDAFAALAAIWPAFQGVFDRFAGLPIRNSATLGGNIANGSPIGDSMPLLIALGASLELASAANTRTLPLEDFYLGYKKTALQADELVTAIDVPLPDKNKTWFTKAYKLSKRFEDDISAVCLALNLCISDKNIATARLGVGGMAAIPVRAIGVEQWLAGKPFNLSTLSEAGTLLACSLSPITDMRASAQYRLAAIQNLFKRAWLESQGIQTNLQAGTPDFQQAFDQARRLQGQTL
jgi:xanthine dehydrogenase small subunit